MIKGIVEDTLALDCKKTLGVGSIVSFANVVKPDGKSLTNLNCINDCMTYLVPRDVIMSIAEEDSNFKYYIYKHALEYYLRIYGEIGYNQRLNDNMISILIYSSEMVTKQKGELLSVDGGGFLYRGVMKPTTVDAFSDQGRNQDNENNPRTGDEHDIDNSSLQSPTRSQYAGRPGNGALTLANREALRAPSLITPLLNGFYKVEEPVLFFAFKAGVLGEEFEMGSIRMSVRNTLGSSVNILSKRTSLQRKLANNQDVEKEYNAIVDKNFPAFSNIQS